jgi:Uma2 family endonuclease
MGNEAGIVALAGLHDVWTFDDLQALPDSDIDFRRFEIVDGALVVSPSAAMRHELVCSRLRRALERAGLPEYEFVAQLAVDLHPSYRVPDILVVTAERARADLNLVPAVDACLVVEVVSPSSRTTDRITKPAQYAAAGIPVYLRVETEGDLTLTLYELEPGADAYTELGTWGLGEVARLTIPFAVDIPIDEIAP